VREGSSEGDDEQHKHEPCGDGDFLRRPSAALDVVLPLLDAGGGKKVDGAHL
jgi:hypothetical protein